MRKIFLFSFILISCGQEPVRHVDSIDRSPGKAPGTTPLDTTTAPATGCPIPFPKAEICGQVTWKTDIVSDAESKFEITFWKLNDSARTPVKPEQALSSFFVMTCCKSVFSSSLKDVSAGVYEGIVKLRAGTYYHYLQIGPNDPVQTLDVTAP